MTGTPNSPAFPARWFTAYTCSPRCALLFSHRLPGLVTRRLIPASRDRDHTTSLVRVNAARRAAFSRPPHPAPRFVTIGRNVPPQEGGMGAVNHIFPKN